MASRAEEKRGVLITCSARRNLGKLLISKRKKLTFKVPLCNAGYMKATGSLSEKGRLREGKKEARCGDERL